ncbi:MAG: hypothetical protein H6738_25840 [Alphaproteobacteria bacterium]|nr:hypothetical protein [Alphaproteobacteria bacterium]MCB9700235.1 hypothetical protein [Alphaproteobacteria bacterium]
MAETDWEVLPHGELVQLAENLWRVEGRLPNMDLERCMVVARTSTGELVLHSAIAMDEPHMAQLEALGRPAWLVVPNGWHRLDAPRYKARYPDLKVVCPAQARKNVADKVPVDGTYADFPSLDPEGTVRLEHIDAERHMEGVMSVRSADGTSLVFADSLFNLPHRKGFFWFVYGRLLGSTGGPRVTLIGKLMMLFTRSAAPFRALMGKWLDEGSVVRLIPGHGNVVDTDVRAVLTTLAGR